jgi:hypothetical protein
MPDPVTDTDDDRVRTEPDMHLSADLHNEVLTAKFCPFVCQG